MAIYALDDLVPDIHPDAFVHPDAVVIGAAVIGAEASVWPHAVVRADFGTIEIGAATSVQDGAVLHTSAEHPTRIGDGCVIGHLAHLEGCTVENGCLVGSGSIVLSGVVVSAGAVVAAGAVVPERLHVPPGKLAVGVPARLRDLDGPDGWVAAAVTDYRGNARRYASGLRRLPDRWHDGAPRTEGPLL